MVLEHFEDEIL